MQMPAVQRIIYAATLLFSVALITACTSFTGSLSSKNTTENTSKINVSSSDNSDPIDQNLIQVAFNDNTAYEVTRSLTMEISPRLAGSPADIAAVEWSKKLLTDLGFEHVHTEPVEAPRKIRDDIHTGSIGPMDAERSLPAASLSNADANILEYTFNNGQKVMLDLNIGVKYNAPVMSVNVQSSAYKS